jgi:hypothetical protein
MLAGVDYVLMGAGIPKDIPAVLDRLADGQDASIKLEVTGWDNTNENPILTFDPAELGMGNLKLERPKFLPIIASNLLATIMARKANGSVEGFVVEGPTAGGHNAPPRGAPVFDQLGQPVYGEKDHVDLEKLAELGLPSGWQVAWVHRRRYSPHARVVRQAFRLAHCSHTARNRAWMQSTKLPCSSKFGPNTPAF